MRDKRTRILICGDRHWKDYKTIFDEVSKINDIEVIIHGAARGADTLGGKVADNLNIPTEVYSAQWSEHGRSAGPIRNIQMLVKGMPDIVLAFHPNIVNSKGTKHMVKISLKNNTKVRVISKKSHDKV